MTDALLLDFNGVVVHDEALHFDTFRRVLAEEGMALDEATYDSEYLGMGNDTIAFEKAGRRVGGWSGARIEQLVQRKRAAYRAAAQHDLPLVAGVAEFVRAARGAARIAVVSGAWRPEVDYGLERAGLADVVETIVAAEDITVGKPEPEGLRLALQQLGAADGGTWRAIVIEDSLPGLAAARALGAGCVMMATSHNREALAGADAVWDSFEGHTPGELAAWWRPVEP